MSMQEKCLERKNLKVLIVGQFEFRPQRYMGIYPFAPLE
jgi:hypothetical protein